MSDKAPAGATIPLPPPEMRQLVGATDPEAFDNPTGSLALPGLAPGAHPTVLDFGCGCGCGRVARRLMMQDPQPQRYVGVDLHRGMVEWCRSNLTPLAPQFEFHHHDVFSAGLNPGEGKPMTAPFPVPDGSFSLVVANSVYTHLCESQAEHYLREAARVLRPEGILCSTWFLFDKAGFPMMQEFQNALYINEVDPTNAVIFDRDWLRRTTAGAGLTIHSIAPPEVRGFQWILLMAPAAAGLSAADFPPEPEATGVRRPPMMPADAPSIGLPGASLP